MQFSLLALLQQKQAPRIIAIAVVFGLVTISAALFTRSVFDNGNDVVSSVDSNSHQLRRLSGGLIDPKTVEPRQAAVIEEGPTATDADTVVLLTVSGGFFDMWTNWLIFFEKLAIPNLPVLLFPEDEQAHQKCLQQVKDIEARQSEHHTDLTCLPWNFAFSEDTPIEDDVGALSYGTDGYKKMMARRPVIVQRELESGHNVIFSDVDVVWKQNPLPFIQRQFDESKLNSGKEAHILGEMGWSRRYRPDVLCPGFMVFRSCPETIAFVDLWRQKLEGKVSSNQWTFNKLLEKARAHELDFDIVGKSLPQKLFASGQAYFQDMKKTEQMHAVVVHNNFIIGYKEKVDRMKKYGLWMV